MIVEIEDPIESCTPALDYNERKLLAGSAQLVGYANLASTDQEYIYSVFERYEKTVYPVSHMSFHASVNPSETDGCSEDDILAFVRDLMSHLGYGRQPYLVYRHNDIDREHYHVITVRVDETGHKINEYYEKRRVTEFMKRNALKYNFSMADGRVLGTRSLLVDGDVRKPGRFRAGGGTVSQLKDIFRYALTYDFATFAQLSCVLNDMGVKAVLMPTDSEPHVTLQGLDMDGEPAGKIFTEEDLGCDLYADISQRLAQNRSSHKVRAREKQRMRNLVGAVFAGTRSEAHFENVLRKNKVGVHLSRTEETGEVYGVTFVDHLTRTVFKASEMRDIISVKKMQEAVASGRWRIEDRGQRRPATYVKRSREAVREAAVYYRNVRVSAVTRLMIPVGQPWGNSWSGKTAKSEDEKLQEKDLGRQGRINATLEDRRFMEIIW